MKKLLLVAVIALMACAADADATQNSGVEISPVLYENSDFKLYRMYDPKNMVTCYMADPKGGTAWAPSISCLQVRN